MNGENENSPTTESLTSQEHDEISQADAPNAIDKFLSFEEDEQKENRY
jgi:hypothetical protein